MDEGEGPVDDDYAAAVGWVAIESAHLEFAVSLLYSRLLRSDVADVVAIGRNWSDLYQGCSAVLAARAKLNPFYTEPLADAQKAIDRADKLQGQRAHVIHGLRPTWPADRYETVLPKRWGKRQVDAWPKSELVRLRNELLEVRGAVVRVHGFLGLSDDELRALSEERPDVPPPDQAATP